MDQPTPEAIFDAISFLNHEIRSRHYQVSREQGAGIAGMEFKALRFIATHAGATQRDLVERSGRDKGQVARVVDKLKKSELVQAVADEHDRRIARLQVTEKGQQLHHEFQRLNDEIARQATSTFTDEECGQLLRLLEQMNQNLRSSEQG
ncbi:MarR family winged helix-turn-helix transcriptional regulator [Terasakiispira papahanaumokuakeensis]|uniref:MarR family winged helix-turn-helix transcriptional regulator n=1 Tax=Terasakiispira papahanaumokuakeensis TaxID=197479 RepID=UPI0009FBC1F6|nr:MarR family transcriptional regulator [Terasakiispira papahanaumokuakeensis]